MHNGLKIINLIFTLILLSTLLACSAGFKSASYGDGSLSSSSLLGGQPLPAPAPGSPPAPTQILSASNDGSANAPNGTAQFPILLNNYLVRPGWKVAGVDYPVGIPTGVSLNDPSTIKITGVTVVPSSHQVWVNASSVTLDKIDFTLDGGWMLLIGNLAPANNVTVSNSKFAIGSNGNALVDQVNGSNTTFIYDVFNGSNLKDNLLNSIFVLSGGMTLEYSLIENAYGDFIDYGASNTVLYNVFDNNGQGPETQPEWMRLGGGVYTNQAFEYNTYIQTASTGGPGSQGIDLGGSGTWALVNAQVAYNTVVAEANSEISFFVAVGIAGVTGQVSVHDNFTNPTGMTSFALANSMSATAKFSNNYNMLTSALMPQNETSISLATASPATGTIAAGGTITLSLQTTGPVTVTGAPTLTLNDGGTATYVGGSGTSALTFTYTVGAGDTAVPALAITQFNLPNGATIVDSSAKAVLPDVAGLLAFTGLIIAP